MLDRMGDVQAKTLILADVTGEKTAGWMEQLKQASEAWSAKTLTRLSDVQVMLEEDEAAHAVIVYTPAHRQLIQMLAVGQAPSEALVAWQEQAEALLGLYRKHWERATLVEANASSARLSVLAEHVSERAGVQFQELPAPETAEEEQPAPEQEEGLFALAAFQLLSMRRARSLMEELEATTVPLGEKPQPLDLIEKLFALRKEEARARAELDGRLEAEQKQVAERNAELAEVRQENALVITQLHKTQEELERRLHQEKWFRDKITALRGARDKRDKQIEFYRGKLNALRNGRDRRDRKIAKLTEAWQEEQSRVQAAELECTRLSEKVEGLRRTKNSRGARIKKMEHSLSEAEAELEAKNAELEKLHQAVKRARAEIAGMKKSRSWRYTKFLRQMNGTEG